MDESSLTSSIPVVYDALMENITTLTRGMAQGGRDVEVVFAMRADNRTTDDVHIGDIEDHVAAVPTSKSGRKARDEEYYVVINVFCARHTAYEASMACMEIHKVISNWLAENIDLGLNLPGLRVLESRSSLNMTYDSTQDYRAHFTMRPFVQCRLR